MAHAFYYWTYQNRLFYGHRMNNNWIFDPFNWTASFFYLILLSISVQIDRNTYKEILNWTVFIKNHLSVIFHYTIWSFWIQLVVCLLYFHWALFLWSIHVHQAFVLWHEIKTLGRLSTNHKRILSCC